jgi:hypothetical protein
MYVYYLETFTTSFSFCGFYLSLYVDANLGLCFEADQVLGVMAPADVSKRTLINYTFTVQTF